MFHWLFKNAWDAYGRGEYDEAEEMAAKLLLEPRLGELHQAGMHLLLSMSPNDYFEHAKEAVRLYTSVLDSGIEMSSKQRAGIERMLNDANVSLEQARSDKTEIDGHVAKLMYAVTIRDRHELQLTAPSASGNTIEDLQEDQIREMHIQFAIDNAGMNLEDHTALRSSPSLPETMCTSQTTNRGRSQSTVPTEMDIDIDDNLSLPDIDKA